MYFGLGTQCSHNWKLQILTIHPEPESQEFFFYFCYWTLKHNGTLVIVGFWLLCVFRSCFCVSTGRCAFGEFIGTLHQTPNSSPRTSGCCHFIVPSSQRCFNCPFMWLPWRGFASERAASRQTKGLFSIPSRSRAATSWPDNSFLLTCCVFCCAFLQ